MFPLLSLVTTVYAILLDQTRAYWRGGLTWLTVVIGVGFCVAAAEAETNRTPAATADDHKRNIRQSLLWGSAPIIIWKLLRSKRYGLGLGE